jgi:hypothetical protein
MNAKDSEASEEVHEGVLLVARGRSSGSWTRAVAHGFRRSSFTVQVGSATASVRMEEPRDDSLTAESGKKTLIIKWARTAWTGLAPGWGRGSHIPRKIPIADKTVPN